MQFKFLNTIFALYITILLVTVVLAYKTIAFGSFLLPGGILVFPLSYFIIDVISEIYGYKTAKQMIWLGLMAQAIFAILLTYINKLPAPAFWHEQAAYSTVINPLVRCVFSICIGSTAGAIINSFCISKWKKMMAGKYFWLRSIGSSIIGETVLSILTFSIAFSGVIPAFSLINLIISAWVFKAIYSIFIAIFGSGLVRVLKEIEPDTNTFDYNPFAIKETLK